MRDRQGGALDKRMSLMLGMNNHRIDHVQKKSSVGEPVSQVTDSEQSVDAKKGQTSGVSEREDSQSENGSHSSAKSANPAEVGRPLAGNEIIMLTPAATD